MLVYFVIVGIGNVVNLIDGFDGLVIMLIVFVVGGFVLVVWVIGNMNFVSYLYILYL